ncbi:MAG: hypothetical protein KIPDCIKN_00110 [Haliscomenobacter sp.]|nr:hypothetical protein [Haliscomenobacter sp.]
MRRWFTLFLLLFSFGAVSPVGAEKTPDPGIFRGYLVTLNGLSLTGHVAGMGYSGNRIYVQYINDLGTFYRIWPQMVKGFVYHDFQNTVVFESWQDKKRWRFLQVLYKGAAMSLYLEPQVVLDTASPDGIGHAVIQSAPVYFVEVNGRIVKTGPANFRKIMPHLLQQRAPHLARKIGNPGYRFKDLWSIVQEYNAFCKQNPFLL